MVDYEKLAYEYTIPLIKKFAEDQSLLNSGIIYAFSRDEEMRPWIYWNVKEYVESGMDSDQFMDLLLFHMTYLQNNAMVPGKIETLNCVVDVTDVAMRDFPVADLFSMSVKTKKNFKLRMHKLTAINVHWALKMAAKVIFTFLPP